MKPSKTPATNQYDSLVANRRTKSIKPAVLAYIAFRNLWAKKLRTMLTISGVVIGIGAIVFLISLGLGLQNVVANQVVGSSSIKTIDVTTANSKSLHLTNDAATRIRNLENVTSVTHTYASGGGVSLKGARTDAVVYGADQGYLELSSLRLAAGKSLKLESDKDALVNLSLLKAIGLTEAAEAIGKTLTVRITSINADAAAADRKPLEAEVTIVGVLETGAGSEIFIRDTVFANAGATQYSQLKVVAKTKETITPIRKQIDGLGFTTVSPIDTLEQINQIFRFFNFILAGFGGIGMTIAVLGMFNTLTISLLERTREIGLMVSLGARRRDIRRLFIIEALCLSFGGGIIGLLGAVGVGQLVNLFLSQLAASRGVKDSISIFSTPLWFVLGILTFVAVIGLLVVYYPARRAARISPIDALRRE